MCCGAFKKMKYWTLTFIILLTLIGLSFKPMRMDETLTYNQRELYIEYGIDTIIKMDGSTTYIILTNQGLKSVSKTYCKNGNLLNTTEFDQLENDVNSTDYDFNCQGKLIRQTIKEYKNGKIVKTINTEGNSIFNTSSESLYDEQGRLKEYRNYNSFGGGLGWKEVYTYEPDKNQRIKLRQDGDGSLISKEITKLDSQAREIESSYFHDERLTSKYTAEYDDFGNQKRYAGYFYPDNRLDNERLSYYSTKHKLDSTKSICCNDLKHQVTYFIYDDKGLLVQEIFHDNRNNRISETTNEYK